ncbi:MAG: hypothetical protein LBU04_07970 [Christensenellaceae bacterium]|jgi:cell division ATPase FtsA|nr:hypothetical protein [Christensenellaceae bacterium]
MKTKRLAVLEIGSDTITLIVQNNKYTNNILFKGARHYEGFANGEFFKKEEIYFSILDLINECGVPVLPESILVGVPGEFTTVVCKEVTKKFDSLRAVTDADVVDILIAGNTYDNRSDYNTINAAPIKFTLDSGKQTITPVGVHSSRISGYISYILCECSFLYFFKSIAKRLGVKFEFTSTILAEVLHIIPSKLRDETGTLFLDIGYLSTTLAYANGDGILYMTSFSLGLGYMAAYISEGMEIPFEHGKALIPKINLYIANFNDNTYSITVGSRAYDYDIRTVNEIASGTIELITRTINRAIKQTEINIPRTVNVLLTGSNLAELPGAKEFIAHEIGRQVSVVRPALMHFDKLSLSGVASLIIEQQQQIEIKKPFLKKIFGRKK